MSGRVVITGWGVASPLGNDRATFAHALLNGQSAGAPIRGFDARGFACRIAAEVPAYDLAASCPGWDLTALVGTGDRKAELGLLAAHQALAHAGLLEPGTGPDAISLGTGLSSVLVAEVEAELIPFLREDGEFDHEAFARGALPARRFLHRHLPGRTTALLAQLLGVTGPRATSFAACAAGAHAIALAGRWIARGEAERVLAGGLDSMINPFGLASLQLLGTLTTRNDRPAAASRPFDRDRDGFLLGEGAAMLVVESAASAQARGAPILAELLGSGSSLDAWHVTAPHPDGRGAVLAMRRALADAGRSPADVDYVNAHGTATPLNDPVEITAFREVFGPHADRCPISSTKSMHGHLIAAAGALEACAVLVALQHQWLPPTINVAHLDPACAADVVPNVGRAARLEVALSNSFGFGGQNGCLVFGTGQD
ncbi:MAG: beta-ketoacyl-[acyl-carrier-protein] synthase family protein [Myxococcota bacterium]|jgi:3-oxoacyl-(acyl-carrier-protein) synthase|nr:beta-ketoacyl-[acyl-carrier-protein] synthase family protein [Myxococcota bacterium]